MPASRNLLSVKQLILLVATLLALIAVLVTPDPLRQPDDAAQAIHLDCDLNHEACRIETAELNARVELQPRPARANVPLSFVVDLSDGRPDAMLLRIDGVEMYMGVNQAEFFRHSDTRWVATTTLALCTTSQMLWRATLEVVSRDRIQHYQMDFVVESQ